MALQVAQMLCCQVTTSPITVQKIMIFTKPFKKKKNMKKLFKSKNLTFSFHSSNYNLGTLKNKQKVKS